MPKEMPSVRQLERSDIVVREALRIAPKADRILEIGPEHGWTGMALRAAYPEAKIIAVEIWEPYIQNLKDRGWYTEVYLNDAVEELPRFLPLMFDVVVACDVVEHLHTGDGVHVLSHMARCGRAAIATMPLGWMRQGALHGNPHQAHRSAWTPAEMETLGWRTVYTSDSPSLGVYSKGEESDGCR